MVHLKYIENPFDEQTTMDISRFYEEKSFYDCIQRKFLRDQAFNHLEYTFYMYLLIGDSSDFIGYVLLSNENRVRQYYQFAYQKIVDLLTQIKNKFYGLEPTQELARLDSLIQKNKYTSNFGFTLEHVLFSLTQLYSNSLWINNMIKLYHQQLQDYLNQLPNYFYLDVVIALPKEEEIILEKEYKNKNLNPDINSLVELKYYGFIKETLCRVEEEIQQKFKDIPIILKKENNEIDYTISNKKLNKILK